MPTHSQRKSRKQEAKVAKDLGGSIQPGSGAPEFYKGDVRKVGDVRVECKTTSSKAYSLKLAEIQKIKGEALQGGGESWAMQIEFQGAVTDRRFAVIDWQEYLDLRDSADVVAKAKKNMSSALLCNHANEVPTGPCQCELNCYCRGRTCKQNEGPWDWENIP